MNKLDWFIDIENTWKEYYNFEGCKYCTGNGCDDCRDCEQNDYKSNLYKKARNLEEGFKNKFGITYKKYKETIMNDYLNKDMSYLDEMNKIKFISAKDARKIATETCNTKDILQLKEIMDNIIKSSKDGKVECYVSNLRDKVKERLIELGYDITETKDPRDGNLYVVNW